MLYMYIVCQRLLQTFYRLLLTKCQDEFESRAKITSDSTNLHFKTEEERDEFAYAKTKMLGNIRFIGTILPYVWSRKLCASMAEVYFLRGAVSA